MSYLVTSQEFGTVADGSTDDSAAINQAAAEAVSRGVELYFPRGNYLLAKAVSFPAGIVIIAIWAKFTKKYSGGYALTLQSDTVVDSIDLQIAGTGAVEFGVQITGVNIVADRIRINSDTVDKPSNYALLVGRPGKTWRM